MRRLLIAANWKENKINEEVADFINNLKVQISDVGDREVLICPSFVSIVTAHDCALNTNVMVGSQDVSIYENGAYTGEISAQMLKDFCKYVLVGHSERRKYFNEDNNIINNKIKIAVKNGINAILCIGENIDQKNSNQTNKFVKTQIIECLKGISKENINNIIIAYEPVWAISGGDQSCKPATPKDIEEIHLFIRNTISELYNEEISMKIRIIYGGSVKPENVVEIMAQKNVDGGLIGNASLELDSFLKLIKY
jgi:triosephosphate isomerase (TIM)